MNQITALDVKKVAKLARLNLPDDQIEAHAIQLEKILSYVEQLKKVDTTNVPPTARAVEVVNNLREDQVISNDMREDLLSLAPEREGDFFKVPKILSE